MRSLFLKVFLRFWLAMVLIVGALLVTSYLTRTERGPRPPQFIAGLMWAYSRVAGGGFVVEIRLPPAHPAGRG